MDSFAGNRTEFVVPPMDSSTISRHPLLYGAAIYALLLIIVGTIGNGLTILILLRPNLRRYTAMRYLTAVAMAHLCSLYLWNLNLFYKHLINPYQNDLEDSSMIGCRLISFIGFVSLQLSSWYLTLVSIDRCLNIYFLFWNRRFGHASRSTWIILTITLIVLLLNSHLLFLNGFYERNCTPFGKQTCFTCYARPNDRHYIFPRWEKVHVIIYNVIPFSVMLVCTCFIIRRSIPSQQIQHTNSTDSKRFTRSTYRQRKQRQVTFILLSVIFLFVLLTTPVMIYNVFLRNRLKEKKPLKYIVHGFLLCVQFTSHAVGFRRRVDFSRRFTSILDQLLRLLLRSVELSPRIEHLLFLLFRFENSSIATESFFFSTVTDHWIISAEHNFLLVSSVNRISSSSRVTPHLIIQ